MCKDVTAKTTSLMWRDSHSPTSMSTNVFHSHIIKWMVVWLCRVSCFETTLYVCHNYFFILSFILNHIFYPRLHPPQHLQGLLDKILSNSKSKLLVSLHKFKFYTW